MGVATVAFDSNDVYHTGVYQLAGCLEALAYALREAVVLIKEENQRTRSFIGLLNDGPLNG